jgi:hypothetical protein
MVFFGLHITDVKRLGCTLVRRENLDLEILSGKRTRRPMSCRVNLGLNLLDIKTTRRLQRVDLSVPLDFEARNDLLSIGG